MSSSGVSICRALACRSAGRRPSVRPLSERALGESRPADIVTLSAFSCATTCRSNGIKRGQSGTIVHVFETAKAYLVEFVNPFLN